MNKNELTNVVSKDMELLANKVSKGAKLLLQKKEELIKEYNKEYEEMEYNLSNGTTSDVFEYFCGTLFLIEKHINEIENQLKALN